MRAAFALDVEVGASHDTTCICRLIGTLSAAQVRDEEGHSPERKVALFVNPTSWDVWQVLDSNQRRLSRRIYSPLPLATRATCLIAAAERRMVTIPQPGTATGSASAR